MTRLDKEQIEKFLNILDFTKIENQLIPVISQDIKTKEILILAFANKEAVKISLESGFVHYFSRSRKKIWKKGETSGHVQKIEEIIVDCDNDSLLFIVTQKGAACHEGYHSCFHKSLKNGEIKIIGSKQFEPSEIYK
jgi:phosphoribosyl-AMP cyclohydrolase